MPLMDRLWLGTVQIGKRYGFAARRQSNKESAELLDRAWAMGVRRFDTAQNYGDAEQRIGAWIATTGNVPTVTSKVSRLDSVPDSDVAAFIAASVEQSRRDLGLDRLDVYLCHRHEDFERVSVRDALHAEQTKGNIGRFGVSCYSPDEALKAMALDAGTGFIQLPGSLVDRRVQRSGLPARAAEQDVTVAVRSLFLQGVLLVADDRLPPHLADLWPAISVLREVSAEAGMPPSMMAIGYVYSRLPEVDMVLGFHTSAQLREVERVAAGVGKDFAEYENAYAVLDRRIGDLDAHLIDPRAWPVS